MRSVRGLGLGLLWLGALRCLNFPGIGGQPEETFASCAGKCAPAGGAQWYDELIARQACACQAQCAIFDAASACM